MSTVQSSIELNDNVSGVMTQIISSVNQGLSAMQTMQQVMGAPANTSSFDGVTEAVNQVTAAIQALNTSLQSIHSSGAPSVPTPQAPVPVPIAPQAPNPLIPPPAPIPVPVEWQSDMQIFTNSGAERFASEINAANTAMGTLVQNQSRITTAASAMHILPANATADINGMTTRLGALQTRLRQLESTPVSMRTDAANNQIEQLRSQLNQALQSQNNLNSALNRMDASAANSAYLQMSGSIANAERLIRNNTNEQGHFNQEVENGTNKTRGLLDMIKGIAAAYMSFAAVKGIGRLSDEIVQTESRLGMMNEEFNKINGTAMQTPELVDAVYRAAQDARGSFSDMAKVVAKFGNNARNAFANQDEVVAFSNLVQKQMAIAGTSTAEASNAMLQLSQALGSGVLRGDELNSIFEQAPNLIQNIADYMGVPMGQIRKMASEGKITGDIVKNAMFAAADEIDEQFSKMPKTWSQIFQSISNTAINSFRPVLTQINQMANSQNFQNLVEQITSGMSQIALAILWVFDLAGHVVTFIADNWSIISPIVMGIVAAMALYTIALTVNNAVTAIHAGLQAAKAGLDAILTGSTTAAAGAQMTFNAALLACPLTWIIMLFIALIAIVYAFAAAVAKGSDTASTGLGVIVGWVYVAGAWFVNLGKKAGNELKAIGAAASAVGHNIHAAFHNAISGVKAAFYSLQSAAMRVISSIASALSKLPFVQFDASGLAASADSYAAKAKEATAGKMQYKDVGMAYAKQITADPSFKKGWVKDAFNAGAKVGDGIMAKATGFFKGGASNEEAYSYEGGEIPGADALGAADALNKAGGAAGKAAGSAADTAGNTKRMADSMDATKEDLKYLRDIAERDVVNRFTTAEIKIEMSNENHISGTNDLDGIVDYMARELEDAMVRTAEGTYV